MGSIWIPVSKRRKKLANLATRFPCWVWEQNRVRRFPPSGVCSRTAREILWWQKWMWLRSGRLQKPGEGILRPSAWMIVTFAPWEYWMVSSLYRRKNPTGKLFNGGMSDPGCCCWYCLLQHWRFAGACWCWLLSCWRRCRNKHRRAGGRICGCARISRLNSYCSKTRWIWLHGNSGIQTGRPAPCIVVVSMRLHAKSGRNVIMQMPGTTREMPWRVKENWNRLLPPMMLPWSKTRLWKMPEPTGNC